MEEGTREATITVQQKNIAVTFKGLWTKSLVDSAHRAMLRDLPRHISDWKKKLSSDKEE